MDPLKVKLLKQEFILKNLKSILKGRKYDNILSIKN